MTDVSSERILEAVAVISGLSVCDLTDPSRSAYVSLHRQLAVAVLAELTGLGLSEIGWLLGERDYSTVRRLWNRAVRRLEREDFRGMYDDVCAAATKNNERGEP